MIKGMNENEIQTAGIGTYRVTVLLAGACILVFLLQHIIPGAEYLLYEKGALDAVDVASGESFRMVTAIFLHADSNHLFSNMVMLVLAGTMTERALGHWRYGVVCLASGIVGNGATVLLELQKGEVWRSLGSSGMVFGIVGALAVTMLADRKRVSGQELLRMAFGIGYALYVGFMGSNINNTAHIGGFLTGSILAGIFSIVYKKKKQG